MLSNFTSKKSDKDGIPASTRPATTTPPPLQNGVFQKLQSPRAPITRAGERSPPSVIGSNLTIMGNLTATGEVQVDGEVQGDIHATHIVIGEQGRITGGIMAQEVVIRGHVTGFVRGQKVMLQATSHVEGDVLHKSLAIEQGAFFEGKSRRSEDPLGDGNESHLAPPPPDVAPPRAHAQSAPAQSSEAVACNEAIPQQ